MKLYMNCNQRSLLHTLNIGIDILLLLYNKLKFYAIITYVLLEYCDVPYLKHLLILLNIKFVKKFLDSIKYKIIKKCLKYSILIRRNLWAIILDIVLRNI